MECTMMDIKTQNFRHSDPITSRLSGEEITNSGRRQKQITSVNAMVFQHEGQTSAELASEFKADRYMVDRRLPDSMLVSRGEHRKCRISGKQAVTWWVKK